MVDIALIYDPVSRRCDLGFAGRDFALDASPASAMLFSLFTDRRAHPNDVLPDAVTDWSVPASFVARRGWCGDALDGAGARVGSRFWLLARRKQTEATRRDAEAYAAEALSWLETGRGLAVQITVRWVARGILGVRARAGRTTLELTRAIA